SFSESLFEYIYSLPSLPDSESTNTAPKSKRRKVDPLPVPFCHAARGHIEFSRPCTESASVPTTTARKAIDLFLSFSLSINHRSNLFKLKSRPPHRLGSFNSVFSLSSSEMSSDVAQIIHLGGDRNGSAGTIWYNVDITLERRDSMATMRLDFDLYWNVTPSPLNGLRTSLHRQTSQILIDTFFPTSGSRESASYPMDFYEAAYVPPIRDEINIPLEIPGLEATLYPYQARSLEWLLAREDVQWSEKNGIGLLAQDFPAPVSDLSRRVQDLDGNEFILNDIFHTICLDNSPFQEVERRTKGGILAEEMGLGKTLEILGLISLHRLPESLPDGSEDPNPPVIPSGATLIVTPESLRQQWISEISRHAPGLRCEFYKGRKREGEDEEETVQRLKSCDIVVTTYSVLSAELHFTSDAPERSRRQERKYQRPKSLLVKILWWRLCLDEAQMIENGISQAAKVSHVIPRVNAWGITGTPVKDSAQDLFGLLMFLRYAPLDSASQAWRAILTQHKPAFQKLFNTIAIRHTKALVRHEISLPPQQRFAISVPFTAVEEQHYQSMFKEMAEACGLDIQGQPVVDEWTPEDYVEEMRTWLNRLRQTALHPEVGVYGRRVLGQNKTKPMRTVEEVLDAMLEQSENSLRSEERALLLNKLTRGQLFENSPRVKEALSIWKEVRDSTEKLVENARSELRDLLKRNTEEKGKPSRGVQNPEDPDDSEDEETAIGEHRGQLGECRRKLRSALELHHRAVFFCANAYFQIRDNKETTEPGSDEYNELKKLEDGEYDTAKEIRREILSESHHKTTRLMKKLSRKGSGQDFAEIPELSVRPERGLESSRVIDELELLYGELNEQANIIDEWREEVVQLLLKSLVDEEDEVETTGEELGESAKIQDHLMVYVQVLRAAIADRQDAMSGQTNELVKYETQTSVRLAKDGEGPAPELLLRLMQDRAEIKPQSAITSMRGAISEFRSLTSRLSNDKLKAERVAADHAAAIGQLNPTTQASELRNLTSRLNNEKVKFERISAEHAIALRQLQSTQTALSQQNKVSSSLESEIDTFTATMNARLEYYRQLQFVSDSVLPFDGQKTEEALVRIIKTEEEIVQKVASAEGKHRYLLYLKEAGSKSNEPRMCVICQTTFETGVLTVCGHQFCKACMMMWFKAHRNCPVCKRHLHVSQLHDITIKPQSLKIHNDGQGVADPGVSGTGQSSNGVSDQQQTTIYSSFNSEKLAEIKNIELDGPSYTSKVDTLVRHLLWLRESDPGAKSIIFSQYKDFLGILATAFKRFRIGYASIDSHGGTARFKEDPAIEVFLLHARAHSSGLNLVNANHVFLCEPLVNTALELQAIARVDRIGQQHKTTVWLYITAGTVEESIYNLSVKRRLEHMGKTAKGKETQELMDAKLEAANTLELEQAALSKLMSKDKTAGEVVPSSDLWECLFGNIAQKEPSEEMVHQGEASDKI
ncbi:unnamed protein product, partial [Clonostachys solani]